MHGHSFKVEISVEGEVDEEIGWVYDHKRISLAMQPLLEELDMGIERYRGLGEPYDRENGGLVLEKLEGDLEGLCEIVIYETPTARVFSGRVLTGFCFRKAIPIWEMKRVSLLGLVFCFFTGACEQHHWEDVDETWMG